MSSPSSFHTAPSSPIPSMSVDSVVETLVQQPRYRTAIPISKEVASHCHIYFDEQLYISALTLIQDLVISGTSNPNFFSTPALAPLPFHVEIVSILLVHPRYTSQAPPNERVELPWRSISFLRSLLSNLGPLNANLGEAFSLTPPKIKGSLRSRNGGDDGSSDPDEEDETAKLKGVVANKGRIRRCAKDFWHIVGWAFNCSVVHHKRWKYWKVWLDYMLDVLDADWKEREIQDLQDSAFKARLEADPEAQCEFNLLRNSLLVKYLSGVKGRSSALKRVVGAAFVDGGPDDLRSYPEVFQNEIMEAKARNGQKRKREGELKHKFGDYDDEEDDVEFESSATPAASQETDDGEASQGPDPWMGGPESIVLRQRVVALLSCVAAYLPDEFVTCRELYEVYNDNMKLLPVPAFSLFLSPSKSSHLPVVVFVSLSQLLLLRLLPNSSPRRQAISKRENDDLTQDILEKCFLPFSANTSSSDDNAKVSILVENMLRLFLKSCKVYHTPSLDEAVEKGVLARESKIKNDKRKRDNSARTKEESDRRWLKASGERLRSLVSWVQYRSSDTDY